MSPEPLVMLKEAAGGSLGLKVAECQIDLEVSGNPNMRMCILFVTCALSTVFLVYNLLKLRSTVTHFLTLSATPPHPTHTYTLVHIHLHIPSLSLFTSSFPYKCIWSKCVYVYFVLNHQCVCVYTLLSGGVF